MDEEHTCQPASAANYNDCQYIDPTLLNGQTMDGNTFLPAAMSYPGSNYAGPNYAGPNYDMSSQETLNGAPMEWLDNHDFGHEFNQPSTSSQDWQNFETTFDNSFDIPNDFSRLLSEPQSFDETTFQSQANSNVQPSFTDAAAWGDLDFRQSPGNEQDFRAPMQSAMNENQSMQIVAPGSLDAALPFVEPNDAWANVEGRASTASSCRWSSCTGISLLDQQHHSHMQEHADVLLEQWSPSSRCNWPKCPSKAEFKSKFLFKRHLTNIHVQPLVCTLPRCAHKKPFGKNGDLERHIRTAHSDVRNYKCLFDDCDAETKMFARKDKWKFHLRQHHQRAKCAIPHCRVEIVDTQEQAEMHTQHCHGSYECAVGGCQSSRSLFTEQGLQDHLIEYHTKMEKRYYSRTGFCSVWKISRHRTTDPMTFQPTDFEDDVNWHDCIECGPEKRILKNRLEVYRWTQDKTENVTVE